MGLSVDSADCLRAWAESLGGITYPLLSDFYPHGQVAQMYGVLRSEGYSERAIFVIDKQGIIRYIDVHNIDLQPDNEELFRILAELEPEAAAAYAQSHPEPARGQSSALAGHPAEPVPSRSPEHREEAAVLSEAKDHVIMYCTPWCPDCRRARAYLNAHNIPYVEVDISRDRAAAARVRDWTNGSETTPTFDVKGTIVVEFDRPRLEKALGIA